MTDRPVHFEVFLRRSLASAWTLELASEDRAAAVAMAEAALKAGEAVAARVMRETLDPASGQYRSLLVFSRGEEGAPARRPKARASDEDGAPLCSGPADLYTVHARAQISRLLEGWLRIQHATAFELLHRPDLVERLDASGLELQHALQKIAIPESQDRGVSVHEVIRRYRKLVDLAVERLLRDEAQGLFPDPSASGGIGACLRRALASGDPPYLLGVCVAKALAGAGDRRGKIERLLDLAETGVDGPGRALLMQTITQPLAEMLELGETFGELAGGALDLGRRVALTLRLVAEDAVEALVRREPGLVQVFAPVPASVARLAVWLRDPAFAGVAGALVRRAMAELQSHRRLHPDDPAAEIATLRALARVLIFRPDLVSPEDVQATFVGRSRHLVRADFVKVYVAAHGEGALREAQVLTTLAENVVGGANRRAAGGWLKAAVCGLRFEHEMLNAREPPTLKLVQLAELARALPHTGLAATDQAEINATIAALAAAIEAKSKLVQAIVHAPAAAVQRLLALLRLAAGETAPIGSVSRKARGEASKLVRDPGVRAALTQSPDDMARVRGLLQATGLAA